MIQAPTVQSTRGRADEPATVDGDDAVQTLLDALEDPDCRAILEATSHEAQTANELSETCGLPLSTAYRKLELLTGTGLLTERTRVSQNGKHASEYIRAVSAVTVSLDEDGDVEILKLPRERAQSAIVEGSLAEP